MDYGAEPFHPSFLMNREREPQGLLKVMNYGRYHYCVCADGRPKSAARLWIVF